MRVRRQVADEIVRAADTGRRTWPAVVTSVVAGGAKDGFAAVTVRFQGGQYRASYMSHYTPVVGHVVRVTLDGNQLHIEGRPGGF